MADNIELNAGTGGAVIAADDITSVWYPINKMAFGALGSVTLAVAGAGNVDGGTQRVTLAADDPAVVDLAAIEVLLTTIAGDTTDIEAAVELIDNAIAAVDDVAGATQVGIPALAVRDDSLSTRTEADGDLTQLRTDLGGRLWVKLDSVSTGVGVTGPVTDAQLRATPVPVSGTVDLGSTDNAVLDAIAASVAAVDGDTSTIIGHLDGVEGLLGTIDADTGSIMTAVQLIDDAIFTDDAAFTPGTSKVIAIGAQADEGSTDSVDEGDAGALRMTLTRLLRVVDTPHTAGGLTIFRSLDIDETEEDVKTSAGQLYWIHAINKTASPLYLKFYNATAANTSVGSTTPVLTLPVPANADSDGAGFTTNIDKGLAFSTAICVACTTGVADADTGAPGANDCVINLGYM